MNFWDSPRNKFLDCDGYEITLWQLPCGFIVTALQFCKDILVKTLLVSFFEHRFMLVAKVGDVSMNSVIWLFILGIEVVHKPTPEKKESLNFNTTISTLQL